MGFVGFGAGCWVCFVWVFRFGLVCLNLVIVWFVGTLSALYFDLLRLLLCY